MWRRSWGYENPPQPGPLNETLERLAERMWVDRVAILLAHDEVVVLIVRPPLTALRQLLGAVDPELPNRLLIEVDDARVVAFWG